MAGSRVEVQLQLPAIRLRASQIHSLETGNVLRLPIARHEPSHLIVGGLHMGKARAVRTGEHRGAKLETPLYIPIVDTSASPAGGSQVN
jgi:flagellar motor switch protein FliM